MPQPSSRAGCALLCRSSYPSPDSYTLSRMKKAGELLPKRGQPAFNVLGSRDDILLNQVVGVKDFLGRWHRLFGASRFRRRDGFRRLAALDLGLQLLDQTRQCPPPDQQGLKHPNRITVPGRHRQIAAQSRGDFLAIFIEQPAPIRLCLQYADRVLQVCFIATPISRVTPLGSFQGGSDYAAQLEQPLVESLGC